MTEYPRVIIACGACDQGIGYAEWERRKQPKGKTRMAAKKSTEPATTAEVRSWAQGKGIAVGAKGRIKADVLEQFTKVTKRPVA